MSMKYSIFKNIVVGKLKEKKTLQEFLKLVNDSLCFIKVNDVKNDEDFCEYCDSLLKDREKVSRENPFEVKHNKDNSLHLMCNGCYENEKHSKPYTGGK